MFRRLTVSVVLLVVLVVALLPIGQPAEAQDGQNLPWGEAVLGQVVSPDGMLFNFQGTAGDVAQIEVTGIAGFTPAIAVQDASRVALAQEDNAARNTTATLSYTIFSRGLYYVEIRGVDNSDGQFTIILNRGLPFGMPLIENVQTEGIISPTLPTIYYDFNPNPNANTRIEVRSLSEGYSPVVTVFSSTGETLASLTSQRLVAAVLEFGPGTDALKLMVDLGNFPDQAIFQVNLSSGTAPSSTGPASTPPVTDTTTGGCLVSTSRDGGVNIRSGGSGNHPIVGLLSPGQTLTATGFNAAERGWFEVTLLDGRTGWVASFVVDATGNCTNLPIKTYAPAPAAPAPSDGGGPAATQEPSSPPDGCC